jgi:hypothetical protein
VKTKKKSALSFNHHNQNKGGRFFQIPLKIFDSFSDYKEKVQAGNFNFPNFSQECPICHGKNCAVRIGYYNRWTIDIDVKTGKIVILQIPIARYLCKGVNKAKRSHRTFSLLPDTLIPYNQISLFLMMYILHLLFTTKSSRITLTEIDEITPEDILISEKTIGHLFSILEQTRIKLILYFQQYNVDRAPPNYHACTLMEIIEYLLNYPVPDYEHPLRGAYYQSVLYYESHGSYHKNARFLFGTASQFCV